jgi:hypothetical protein
MTHILRQGYSRCHSVKRTADPRRLARNSTFPWYENPGQQFRIVTDGLFVYFCVFLLLNNAVTSSDY